MVVFPNGHSGERLAKRARQSERASQTPIYMAERANSRCSKSFTPDAKMIKGFFRPSTCTFYLYIVTQIYKGKSCYTFLSWNPCVVTILLPLYTYTHAHAHTHIHPFMKTFNLFFFFFILLDNIKACCLFYIIKGVKIYYLNHNWLISIEIKFLCC